MRNKLSTLFTLVLLLSSQVWALAQTIREIEIDPASPAAGQSFTVTLKGDFPNACYSLSYINATVSAGNYLNLNFQVNQSAGPCAAVVTPFTFTRTFHGGISTQGYYCLRFYGGLSVNTTDSRCFNVLPPPNYSSICDANIATIYCGSTVSSNNNYEPNRLTNYECKYDNRDLYSGEKVYRLKVEEYSEVRLDMKILDNGVDLDMFLISDVCYGGGSYYNLESSDCLAQATINKDNSKERNIVAKLEPGYYLVIIDGESNYDRGRFTLTVDCGYRDLCTKAAIVNCGDQLLNQSTINGRNDVWQYTCGTGVYDSEGNDRVYKIKLEKPTKLFVEMNILSPGEDLQLTLLKGEICPDLAREIHSVNAEFCLGRSPEYGTKSNRRTILQDLPAGTYYITVDARMAMTQGNYNISFNCDPVPCGLSVVPSVLDFTSAGGAQTLTINTTRGFSTYPTQSWLDLSPRSANTGGTTKVSVLRKSDSGSRQESITFTCGTESQTVLVTQAGSCKPNAFFTVSKSTNQVIISAPAQDSSTYSWKFSNGQTSNKAVDTVDLLAGVYRLCLTVSNKCGTATSCQLVRVAGFATASDLSSLERPKLSQARLYPNPSNGEAFVEFDLPQAGRAQIQVFDLSGREVNKGMSLQLDKGVNQTKLSVDPLQRGVYLVRVTLAEGSWTEKLVVE
ncbi:MAG TPA: T9SS type A sorting domain-containing protein [Haliscomenobacter sp.]|uniref:T9SS type A sorting domain-containing protein n=1 Tax=Haliscomenobacter sp. TaxID=2717303 RepID=UPI002C99BB12|nr:T9SS type A sorting domain-containing protein [Haliscomenobacter sp.]HOY16377.1 T9SS type A sorting domain-containing protein [Haliscomenobacter sp.]